MKIPLKLEKTMTTKFIFKNIVLIFSFVFSLSVSTPAQTFDMPFSDVPETLNQGSNIEIANDKFARQKKLLIDLFSFIDEYENTFLEMKYLNVLGQLPELKIKFNKAMQVYRRYEAKMQEQLQILGNLYQAKYELFTGMGDMLKNLRLDSGFRAALLRSGTVVLQNYNQLLDDLKNSGPMQPLEIQAFKRKISTTTARNQKYTIQSKYLKIADEKIPAGEKIIVLEIEKNKALVLYMGPTMTNEQIEGWVSLRDLEKRTDWNRSNAIHYQK